MAGTVKTVGVKPAVPVQSIIAVAAFLLAFFGVELTAEVSLAIATVLQIVGGVLAGPGEVEPT